MKASRGLKARLPGMGAFLRPVGRSGGFTLFEVILAIVILGAISVTVGMLLYQGTQSFEEIDLRRELTAQGGLASERISRELRLIRCTTAGSNCNPQAADMTSWTSGEIRFVNIESAGRGIRLDAGAVKLRQGSGALDPEDALAPNASALSVEYLKKDGTAAAAVSDIWRITLSFTLAKKDESVDFRVSVHPRGFK
jgi:prepilin-type N-terminal cleavage/methylation domain-containing protein